MSVKTLSELIQTRFEHSVELPAELDKNFPELQHILGHRSHRAYRPNPVPAELLQLLFASALSAPSKSDLQQADIIYLQDPGQRHRVTSPLLEAMPWIAEAPVFLIFCANHRRLQLICRHHEIPFANDHLDSFFNAAVDTGIVLMNFIRAAEALELGCCPISMVRNYAERISDLLNLPDQVFPVAGLCVGYPRQEGRLSPRLPLQLTVHTDRYDEQNWQQHIEDYDRYRDSVQPIARHRQRAVERFGEAGFYGWSEDKARQYAEPQRADFGEFIRAKKFSLD